MSLQLRDGGFYVDGHGNVVGPWDAKSGSAKCRGTIVREGGARSGGLDTNGTWGYDANGTWVSARGAEVANNLVREYVATLRPGGIYKTRAGFVYAAQEHRPNWILLNNFAYATTNELGSREFPGRLVGLHARDDITHEVLDDGTEIPLPATWEEHDAYVAGASAPARRAIEMVRADIAGRYRVRWKPNWADGTGRETVLAEAVASDGDDGTLTYSVDGHGAWTEEHIEPLARVLPNGTEVPIGALMITLEEAMAADALLAVAPTEADLAGQAAEDERTLRVWLAAEERRTTGRMTSRDMACGFFPNHWTRGSAA
jgi:hypothetical protein